MASRITITNFLKRIILKEHHTIIRKKKNDFFIHKKRSFWEVGLKKKEISELGIKVDGSEHDLD